MAWISPTASASTASHSVAASNAWTTLVTAYRACFPFTADDPEAHRVYRLMRAAGLEAVGYRPVLVGVRSGDAWQDYLPSTVESLRVDASYRAHLSGKHRRFALA